MKALVTRSLIALVIVTGFTVTAEAQPVQPEAVSITITASTSSVGVLTGR